VISFPQAGRTLIFIGDRLSILQKESLTVRAAGYNRLRDEFKRLRSKVLSVTPPPESTTYAGIQAMNLSLLYLLSGDQEVLDEARRWINTAVGWQDWGNAHLVNVDLSASWLMWGLSLSFDWIGQFLPETERLALEQKLIRQARFMFEYQQRTYGEGWSTNYWQNHNWINMNGLATAAYALTISHESKQGGNTALVEEFAEWNAACRSNFARVMKLMAHDGSDYEGTVYWRYGVPWLLTYAELERERGGVNYFTESPFLRETFWYRLYQCMPGWQETANFGDCHETRSSHSIAMYYKFASEYGIGEAQWLAEKVRGFMYREQYESQIKPGILPEAGLEYLWFEPQVQSVDPAALPLNRFFPDLGLWVSRSSWNDDAIHFSVKCGDPGGQLQWQQSWKILEESGMKVRGLSHQHPDNMSFILHAHGSYLVCDEGYNRSVKAAHHNMVIVDGKGYRGEGDNNVWRNAPKDKSAYVTYRCENKAWWGFEGEHAELYDDSLQMSSVKRLIVGLEGKYFIVYDRLASAIEHDYQLRFHMETVAKETPFGYRMVNGHAFLDVHRLLPTQSKAHVEETYVKAVMTTQEPDKFRESRLQTLCIATAEKSQHTEFLHVLVPGHVGNEHACACNVMITNDGLRLEVGFDKQQDVWLFGIHETSVRKL